jgi:hypothetical protein
MFGCDLKTGGESGIRTHVTLSSKHAFQACAFSHSAISPAKICERSISRSAFSEIGNGCASRLDHSMGHGRNSANRKIAR